MSSARRSGRGAALAVAAMCLGAITPSTARAHKPSDSYLAFTLDPEGGIVAGTWDIALRDLDYVLALDADGDGALTRGELRARTDEVSAYALERLSLAAGGDRCVVRAGALGLVEHSDGRYARLPLAITCPRAAGAIQLDYRLFFDVDPQHRGLVRLDESVPDGATSTSAPLIVSAQNHQRALPPPRREGAQTSVRSPSATLASFVAAGARHIADGLDHLLFLLALLLPAVLRRDPGGRAFQPVAALAPALKDVARVVTAFTVAHSLTLTLAVLGLARMPSRLVEPAIAASVAIAAANNLWPLFGRDRWTVAFALGLLHGFGFSSALADGGFTGRGLAAALFGFNLGVELGQLALVTAFVPVAFLARRTFIYRRVALAAGSLAIGALALIWFVERSFDVRLLTGRS